MALEGQQDGDIRAVLALSRAEALAGTKRILTLPEGQQIVIPVPAGIRNGQEIRLEGRGQPSLNGRKGALVLTIALEHIEPPRQSRHGQPTGMIMLLTALTVFVMGASVILLYFTVIQPNQLRAQTTAASVTKSTAPSPSQARDTAQAGATAQAQMNATARVQIQAVAQTKATATVLQHIFNQETSGNPVLNDSLNQQDNNNWEVDSKAGGGGCAFTNGAYHVSTLLTGFFSSCYVHSQIFSNFVFQVQMTVLKGDRGGIIFRADPTNTKFYFFRVGQDGSYDLYLYVDTSGSNAQLLAQGSSSAIHTGLNHPNKIAVIANGSNLSFYVDQQFIVSIKDTTYQSGSIGVFADDQTNPTEVAFSNAKVWTL